MKHVEVLTDARRRSKTDSKKKQNANRIILVYNYYICTNKEIKLSEVIVYQLEDYLNNFTERESTGQPIVHKILTLLFDFIFL